MIDLDPRTNELFNKFSDGNNPFMFAMHKEPKHERHKPTPEEERVMREQHKTLFEHDEAMQRMFKNNFEEYFQASLDPDIMFRKMEERAQEIDKEIAEREERGELPGRMMDDSFFMQDEPEIALEDLEFGMDDDSLGMLEEGEMHAPFDDDPLFQKAHAWMLSFHNQCHEVYDRQGKKDPDLFRVIINSTMVPAKIVYGSSYGEPEESDPELAVMQAEADMKGYTLASTFLSRVRESLKKLITKQFEPIDVWKRALAGADELALELSQRMVEISKKMHGN